MRKLKLIPRHYPGGSTISIGSEQPSELYTRVPPPDYSLIGNTSLGALGPVMAAMAKDDDTVINSYLDHILWFAENAENKGYNPKTKKYAVYDDRDPKTGQGLPYNIGPGIGYTSNIWEQNNIDMNKEYTRQELNNMVRIGLQSLLNSVKNSVNSESRGAWDRLPLGDKLVFLDIAYNVKPRETQNNLPHKWPKLLQAILNKQYDTARKQTRSGSDRRARIRNSLLGLSTIDPRLFQGY